MAWRKSWYQLVIGTGRQAAKLIGVRCEGFYSLVQFIVQSFVVHSTVLYSSVFYCTFYSILLYIPQSFILQSLLYSLLLYSLQSSIVHSTVFLLYSLQSFIVHFTDFYCTVFLIAQYFFSLYTAFYSV